MKKISEMTEDEVRDYALQLEGERAINSQAIADKDNEIAELKGLNLDLQKRNRALFIQVEQQPTPAPADPQPPVDTVESIEDTVKNKLFKEIIK